MSGSSGTNTVVPRFLQATKSSSARESSRVAQQKANSSSTTTRAPSREREGSAAQGMIPRPVGAISNEGVKRGNGVKRSNSVPSKQALRNINNCNAPNAIVCSSDAGKHASERPKNQHKPVMQSLLGLKGRFAQSEKSTISETQQQSSNSKFQRSQLNPSTSQPDNRKVVGTKPMLKSLKRAESARVQLSKKPYLVPSAASALPSAYSSSSSTRSDQETTKSCTSVLRPKSANKPSNIASQSSPSGKNKSESRERIKSNSLTVPAGESHDKILHQKVTDENMEVDNDQSNSSQHGANVTKDAEKTLTSNAEDSTVVNTGTPINPTTSTKAANSTKSPKTEKSRATPMEEGSGAKNVGLGQISNGGEGDQKKLWCLQDFEIGNALGRGRFGCVYVAREKQSKFVVAIKVMFKKDLENSKIIRQVKREIQVQSHLKHPHILRLYSYFQDEERLYIVLDYASNGELYKYLKRRGKFTEEMTAKYIHQLSSALIYLQQNGVIHRDLKPENLLLDNKLDLKLADFGWTVHSPDMPRSTLCGTPDYLSPEMLLGQEYTAAVDIWSMGVLCYEFLHGKPPFETPTIAETYERIKEVNISWPESIGPEPKRFISGLLKFDPTLRTPLREVQQDPWIVANYNPISSATHSIPNYQHRHNVVSNGGSNHTNERQSQNSASAQSRMEHH